MKTILFILAVASLSFNVLCVKSCMDAKAQIAEINNHLKDVESKHEQSVVEYQQAVADKMKDIDNLSAEGELLRHERDNLKVKYQGASSTAAHWKKKFADSNSVEDCTELVGSLEFSLAICNQENAVNESGWTLCERRYSSLEDVVVLKDGAITEHIAFQNELRKIIDKQQALLKAPKKISIFDVIIPLVAFAAGVAIGG